MRGQFATAGSFRLLVLYTVFLFCFHPIRKKLYVPLFFCALGMALAFLDAMNSKAWSSWGMAVCFLLSLIVLCIQEMGTAIQQNRGK